jgi:general secretion pathway protein M
MVAGAAAFAALAVLWWVFIEPAWDGRARLLKDLPALRSQVAEVAGIAQVMSSRPAPVRGADLAPGVEASQSASGLSGKVTANASGSVSARFEKVVYSTAAAWAQRTARELGAHLEAVSVSSPSSPASTTGAGEAGSGRVNAEFVFAR